MKYMLVYQGQNAHVCRVGRFKVRPEGRNAEVVATGSHDAMVREAQRLLNEHNGVKTAHADEPGDILGLDWHNGPGDRRRYVVSSRANNRKKGRVWREPKIVVVHRDSPAAKTAGDRETRRALRLTPERRPNRTWVDYKAYIKSDQWKERRFEALKRASFRCQVCNSRGPLDVHHRTYDRLGDEDPRDLLVLCRGCHDLFHANGKLAK